MPTIETAIRSWVPMLCQTHFAPQLAHRGRSLLEGRSEVSARLLDVELFIQHLKQNYILDGDDRGDVFAVTLKDGSLSSIFNSMDEVGETLAGICCREVYHLPAPVVESNIMLVLYVLYKYGVGSDKISLSTSGP